MPEEPGFRTTRVVPEMLGDHPEDWRAYIEVSAYSIALLEDIISLGNRYALSVGAHDEHLTLLMDRCAPEPLTVERCLNSCALISYASDSPVVPKLRVGNMGTSDISQFSRTFRSTVFRTLDAYGNMLDELTAALDPYLETGFAKPHSVQRVLGRNRPRLNYWLYYPWPPTEKIFRGISAYWLGLLSAMPHGRILNFWRAFEAVTNLDERTRILESLHAEKVAPVWSEVSHMPIPEHETRKIDAARLLRRVALKRRDALVKNRGSAKAAIKYLWDESRGKAAHADRKSLEYDLSLFVGEQLLDAELLRYMARVAIERSWRFATRTTRSVRR